MQEIWKDIEGYEGRYQISNFGRIASLLPYYKSKTGERHLIKTSITRGYETVGLVKDKKRKNFLVHRLVAIAFIPNPNNYKEINHIDEDKLNNNVTNLEWCTRAYNMAYGTARLRQGLSCGKSVIQYEINGFPVAKYCSAQYASKITGIESSSIIKCCRNKRICAGGYLWKYE